MKKILKSTVYRILSQKPLLAYARKTKLRHKVVVLMYHEIADDADEIEAWTVVRKN